MLEIDMIIGEKAPTFKNPPLFSMQDDGTIAVANPSFYNESQENLDITNWIRRVNFHIGKISQRYGLNRSATTKKYLIYKGWKETEEKSLQVMSIEREISNLSKNPFLFAFEVFLTVCNLFAFFTATTVMTSAFSGAFFLYGVFLISSFFKDSKNKKKLKSTLLQEKSKLLEIEYKEAKDWLSKNV